ncbi:NAD(P)-dependent alcohol dehydrogenase [Moraxella sp. FZFQ2102]|uniref:NADPH-dependent aldehyde reductase Ahr n=1 Tax=Moraxella sp. FZFQ2102 TaxID=2953752 RepID=UPI00209BF5E9|nr:NAD(P)-dependent alcohol dehydrogenase [Moraxella sp. FZFQ2102]USZ15791.1 NAD(P)-dependent alcohol dehydrogenase [Moraxella sp. FZFQ2102]
MTTNTIRAYAVHAPHSPAERYDYDAGALKADEVEIKVYYCGICHSDLSMMDNEWGTSVYPLVAGHEIIGEIIALGSDTKGLSIGQMVGVGWTAESCQHCDPCIGGKHHVCKSAVPTVLHKGGFADKVRAQWQWVIPMPDGIDYAKAGPLLCGGITVFQPLLQHHIQAHHKVGVIGVGGLGHMALEFFNAWGCEVTAFSSNPNKYDEIYALGAHHILDSTNPDSFADAKNSLDLIVSTVNVPLDWKAYMKLLKPEGKLHMVGAVLEPMSISAFSLIGGAKSVTGSPTGSPIHLRTMMDFAARKQIHPVVEEFPMSEINDAIRHLQSGKARYRVVLKNDFD